MGFVDVRADLRTDGSSLDAVDAFFEALGAGDIVRARRLSIEPLSWFGRTWSDREWRGESLRRFLAQARIRATNVRALSSGTIAALPSESVEQMFGAVTARDRIVFADIQCGAREVTAVVLVSRSKGQHRIARVMDPEPFSRWMRLVRVHERVQTPRADVA
jgi:hypothetical protein